MNKPPVPISSGKDETPSSTLPWVLAGGGAVVGLGVVMVLVVALGRRRRRSASAPAFPGPQGYGPAPQWQPAARPYGLPPGAHPGAGPVAGPGPRPGQPYAPQAPVPAGRPDGYGGDDRHVADLEREIAELRRRLDNRPEGP
ncbi:hypothetical protein AB0M95_07860 [Sphaerisporangium sp. NPDC051017]|uniref:hypothetical protein n=1 Tax=Sphaerisporangium sp. NPDC051017 TaxID=3154636 RepID=UPI00343BBCC7